MKNWLKIAVSALLCAMSLTLFVGCDKTGSGSQQGAASAGQLDDALSFNVKYIEEKSIREEDLTRVNYFIFYSDGTGLYHTSEKYSGGTSFAYVECSTYFKYTYLDSIRSGIMCFFDRMSDYIVHDPLLESVTTKPSDITTAAWDATLSISRNIVILGSSSPTTFINENFIKTIPNYRA